VKLQVFRGQGAFERARALAAERGLQVCGGIDAQRKPFYILAEPDEDDAVIESRMFAVRHGREPSPAELSLRNMAERHRPIAGMVDVRRST